MAMFYEFGEAIRMAREGKRWTRVQATMRINEICKKREKIVSLDSLEKWENGRILPKIEPVYAMAQVYGKPELIPLRISAIELATKEKAHFAEWTN